MVLDQLSDSQQRLIPFIYCSKCVILMQVRAAEASVVVFTENSQILKSQVSHLFAADTLEARIGAVLV